jgi:hypothetical protein
MSKLAVRYVWYFLGFYFGILFKLQVSIVLKDCRVNVDSSVGLLAKYHSHCVIEMGIEPNNKSSVLFGSLFESCRFCSVRFGASFYKVRVWFGSQV